MNTLVGGGTSAPGKTDAVSNERFIVLGDVLDFRRAHPASFKIDETDERLTLDHCLAIRQGDIQAFRIGRSPRWVDYDQIVRGFELQRKAGSRSHNSPFSRDRVFAPVKVLVSERPNPVRALLTYLPVYPWRGKMGSLIPGQRLWLAYAATAMLNSAYGQGFYAKIHRQLKAAEPSVHGLDADVLLRMPVARRNFVEEHLESVAELSYQLSALYDAQHECRTRFTRQIQDSEQYLNPAVSRLLDLSESEERELKDQAGIDTGPPDVGMFSDAEVARLPNLPPVQLLTEEQRLRLEQLHGMAHRDDQLEAEFANLKQIRFWEETVRYGLPQEVAVDSEAQAA